VRAPHASTVTRLGLVALGGALGSVLRYLVANAAMAWAGPAFPWGTLAVNLVGSFVLGLLVGAAVHGHRLAEGPDVTVGGRTPSSA